MKKVRHKRLHSLLKYLHKILGNLIDSVAERKSTFVYAGYQGECEGTLQGEENAFQL